MLELDYSYDAANSVRHPDRRPVCQRRWPFWAIFVGVLICFAVIDFSFCSSRITWTSPPFQKYWMAINMGAIGAQGGLLAIYAVLGPGRIWLRHVVAIALGLGCILAWWLGFTLVGAIFPLINLEAYAVSLDLPALFFAGCVPLWVVRTLFRWRIESQLPGQIVVKPPQLSIAGIFVATFVVALVLTLVRLGAYVSDDAEWWPETGYAVAVTAVTCLCTLPLSTWAIFRTRSLAFGTLLAAVCLCMIGLAFFYHLGGGWPDSDVLLIYVVVIASLIVFLLGPLIVCRCFHYRLIVGRQRPQTHAAVLPAEI